MQTVVALGFCVCSMAAGYSSAQAMNDPQQRVGYLMTFGLCVAGIFFFGSFLC